MRYDNLLDQFLDHSKIAWLLLHFCALAMRMALLLPLHRYRRHVLAAILLLGRFSLFDIETEQESSPTKLLLLFLDFSARRAWQALDLGHQRIPCRAQRQP